MYYHIRHLEGSIHQRGKSVLDCDPFELTFYCDFLDSDHKRKDMINDEEFIVWISIMLITITSEINFVENERV